MLDHREYNNFIEILKSELIPALGCTEPIAIALAAAKARRTLGRFPEKIVVACSGNIIKNAKGVVVPNSNGKKGILAAAALGAAGGDPDAGLEVLCSIRRPDIERADEMLAAGCVICELIEDVAGLYIKAYCEADGHSASVTIEKYHTNVTQICSDGKVVFEKLKTQEGGNSCDKSGLTLDKILEFADIVSINDIEAIITRQIELNTAISEAGLNEHYGAQVGRTLLEAYGSNLQTRARAKAAAGSDARMGGCLSAVVINSGSGNQGITVSVPVIEYARELKVGREKLYRALVLSNLVAIYQKTFIGSLSAFCGAVCAACGAGAAITYLCGGDREQISATIVNTLADTSGMVCDGAKPSCAIKIATAVDAAILAHNMSMRGRSFSAGEGFLQDCADETIRCVGYIGREGMHSTDITILNVMNGDKAYNE